MKKKKNKQREFKPPLKIFRSLDESHPGISKHPSAEYFVRRKVNDMPGHPREEYFSTTVTGIPKS